MLKEAEAVRAEGLDAFRVWTKARRDGPPALEQQKWTEARDKLQELMNKADRSDELESLLEKVLQNSDDLGSMASELGVERTVMFLPVDDREAEMPFLDRYAELIPKLA